MTTILMCLVSVINIMIKLVLVLLGLVLLIVVICLFSSIKYDLKGAYPCPSENSYYEIKLKWIMGMVQCIVSYKDKLEYNIICCGLSVRTKNNSKQDKAKEDKVKQVKNNDAKDTSRPLLEKRKKREELLNNSLSENLKIDPPIKKKNTWKIKLEVITKGLKKIKWHLKNICAIIKRLYDVKETFEKIFQKWIHKQTLDKLKIELLYLWRKLKPRYIKCHGEIGFEDPSYTGKSLALAGILIPLLGECDFDIIPNFENEIYEVEYQVSGEIKLIYILISLIRILKDKGNRYTFKVLRKVKW